MGASAHESQGHLGPVFTGERGSPNAFVRVRGPQTPVILVGKMPMLLQAALPP